MSKIKVIGSSHLCLKWATESLPYQGSFICIPDHTYQQGDQSTVEQALDDTALLIFSGGADISPTLYGVDTLHPKTGPLNTIRDSWEVRLWMAAVMKRIPIVGICRGAQFCTAMTGGTLAQHIRGHTGVKHRLIYKDALESFVTIASTHHQMCLPNPDNTVLLAWTKGLSKGKYEGYPPNRYTPNELEPEIMYWPKYNCLGIQGHPEYAPSEDLGRKLCEQYLHMLMNNPSFLTHRGFPLWSGNAFQKVHEYD